MPEAGPPASLEPAEVAAAALAAAGRFRELLTTVTDGSVAIPGMAEWTIRDLVAHVACGPAYYRGGARGTSTFAVDGTQMPGINAANVATLVHRPLDELGEILADGYAAIADDVLASSDDTRPTWPTHGGVSVTPTEALALLIGELEVHGRDLAMALDAPWTIPARDVELALRGVSPILPAWVATDAAAGHDASYEVRLRGQGTHRWRFDAGALTVEPTGTWRPDVVISAAPAPLLLVFYGRVGLWGRVLRAEMVAWGRKPWLAFGLPRLFLPA